MMISLLALNQLTASQTYVVYEHTKKVMNLH